MGGWNGKTAARRSDFSPESPGPSHSGVEMSARPGAETLESRMSNASAFPIRNVRFFNGARPRRPLQRRRQETRVFVRALAKRGVLPEPVVLRAGVRRRGDLR